MKSKGFTLIEMMVTVLIFSIIVGAAVGIFVSALKLQRYNLAYQQLLGQVSYAMEYMSRTLRMAKREETSPPTCLSLNKLNYEMKPIPGGGGISGLMFKNYNNKCKGFFRQDGKLKDYEEGRDPAILLLTSENFNVVSLNFQPSGEGVDTKQPRVTIFMEIIGTGPAPQPKMKIQTTISQRDLDI